MKASSMGWALLAAAIVKSAQQDDDKHFLKSSWCSTLTDMVSLSLSQKGGDSYSYFNKSDGTCVPSSGGHKR